MSRQTIYDRLRAGGLSEAGALALLGNWECESNCEPRRVQGDFCADRRFSRDYAYAIDNGVMTDSAFCRDAKGWGLAQWTYWPRKEALLSFCRARSISVANEEAQVDFALKELREDYASLLDFLCRTDELEAAVSRVCCEYERPAVSNVLQRYEAALRVKGLIDAKADGGTPGAASPTEEPQMEDTPTTPYWPPRVLCEGMQGADVAVLQAHLRARGYNAPLSGVFDSDTGDALLDFQDKSDLVKDKIAGPKTFCKLAKDLIWSQEGQTNERT